ncbi:MAG: hypothetical protein QM731_02110 [Chitinophagaceae bacterium]
MDGLEFLKGIQLIPLDDSEYRKVGLSEEFIANNKERYCNYKRNPNSTKDDTNGDPLVELLTEFDMRKLFIGMIEFNEGVKKLKDFWVFGRFEIDELAINTTSGEIVLIEELTNKTLLYCAKNSSAFLEALVFIGRFLEKRVVDDTLFEDESINIAIAEKSAEIAGGNKYFNFYRTMVGV